MTDVYSGTTPGVGYIGALPGWVDFDVSNLAREFQARTDRCYYATGASEPVGDQSGILLQPGERVRIEPFVRVWFRTVERGEIAVTNI